MGYKVIKTVGSDVRNWGSVLGTLIKLMKDLHSSQASVSNSVSEYVPIPYLSVAVKVINSIISSGFEVAHLGTEVGSKTGGEKLIEMGDKLKMRLKETKQRKLEKKIQNKDETSEVSQKEVDLDEVEKKNKTKYEKDKEKQLTEKELKGK